MNSKGNLYLIPNVIAEHTADQVIHPFVKEQLKTIQHFLAEDIRTARRFLSSLKVYSSIEPLNFSVLNKDTAAVDLDSLMKPLLEGNNLGVITESGCPGVADPGAMAVAYAHQSGIRVVPWVGPSSLLLALMASGLNGQHFAFHGYLPVDVHESSKAIKAFERESKTKKQTQIFIETPYRNNQLYSAFIKTLEPGTHLCIAVDITGSNEFIQTKRVADWKQLSIEWPKLPAVFLFLAH